jgi:hypothetical protein
MQIFKIITTLFASLSMWTTVKPQAFTELYFTDSANLPQEVKANQKYNFSFTIHNLEQSTTRYTYEVLSGTTILDQNSVSLQNGETKTISEKLGPFPKLRTEIIVELINTNQIISFWMN